MNNKILIMHVAIGPTYKERLLNNLINCDGYDLYDVLVLTDQIEYFDSVKNKNNFFIKDINEFRKNYPWSIEHEKIPNEKTDEVKYAKERLSDIKFPTLIERFLFDWEEADRYDGFITMSCDVIPLKNIEEFKITEKYFTEKISRHPMQEDDSDLKNKIIIIPGDSTYDYEHHKYLIDYAEDINQNYKITDKKIIYKFPVNDGNFRSYNFPDKESRKKFFNLINNIVYDIYVNNKYFLIGDHCHWRGNAEYIMSIVMNLMDGIFFPRSDFTGLTTRLFRVDCYPEDRFWSWGWDYDIEKGKKGFIEKNYDQLKTFYENRGQKFPY